MAEPMAEPATGAAPGAAPFVRRLLAQARVEGLATLRNGESVLLTLGIPVMLLLFFANVDVLPTESVADEAIDFLAPGVLTLALLSTSMTGLAIATGFERKYGVLKRLGVTPLGRPALLGGKTAAVVGVVVLQVLVISALSLAMGWRPDPGGVGLALLAAVLGVAAFAGLGFLMAGTLEAEITLAAANGLWLVFLLLGGIVVPLAELPDALETVARLLPVTALGEIIGGTVGDGADVRALAWVVLVVWAVVAPAAAARWFRWE